VNVQPISVKSWKEVRKKEGGVQSFKGRDSGREEKEGKGRGNKTVVL